MYLRQFLALVLSGKLRSESEGLLRKNKWLCGSVQYRKNKELDVPASARWQSTSTIESS